MYPYHSASHPQIKPSDAKAWAACARRVWFDNYPPNDFEAPKSAFDELIIKQGLLHENQVLEGFRGKFQVETATSMEHTLNLMLDKVEVIYQGKLIKPDENLIGDPDFLILHESGEYQPADAKLARSIARKKDIKVQVGLYRRMLGNGLPGIVYLGNGKTAEIGDEVNQSVDDFIIGMNEILASPEPPLVRYSHSKCKQCPYFEICNPGFEQKGELSIVYHIDSRAVPGLETVGITSIEDLANTSPEKIPDVPYLKGLEKKEKAVLQAKALLTGEIFKLNEFELPAGTWVHFDLEDNPLETSGEKHVYLWGFLKPGYDQESFEYSWSDTMEHDYDGWIGFLNLVEKYRDEYPDLHIVHFTNHEVNTIKEYVKRYEMEGHPMVEWFLGENTPLYDLQQPVLDNLILPLRGYGLKDICKHRELVNFQWEDEGPGGQWSIVQFVRFLETQDQVKRKVLKNAILGYNRDDVLATRKLEEWLRQL